jgi:hypothetical protein
MPGVDAMTNASNLACRICPFRREPAHPQSVKLAAEGAELLITAV